MPLQSDTALLNACRTLFGKDVILSREFLNHLQPSSARTAFRSQAKAHHPDAHAHSSSQIHRQQTERFREICQAYDLIIDFLAKRQHNRQATPKARPSQTPSHWSRNSARQQAQEWPQARSSSVPAIPLEFGMFAYYQGRVSYQQLIEALVWQRRQRPTLGSIARKWGWLSDAKVAQILAHRGHAMRFGNKAIEIGYLDELLHYQRSLQQRIGQYFIERGLLTEEEAEHISQGLKDHNGQVSMRAKRYADVKR
ncbi:MAG: J domain-containing protein [Desulfuromonadales bacterium]